MEVRGYIRRVLADKLEEAGRGQLRLRVAENKRLLEKHPDMHFHFKPEIFVQLSGDTVFATPSGELQVAAGEVAILPAGVPHGERVSGGVEPFRNLVVGFYSHTVSIHLAFEAAPGKPDIEAIEFFPTPQMRLLEGLIEVVVGSYHAREPMRKTVIRSLMQGFLAMLINLVEAQHDESAGETEKIFQTKWIVREQLSNPELNVKRLAKLLSCSADYLSHLFRQHTGENLIHYIQRQRTFAAMQALRTTQLSISEVAWASGYDNPGYFIRVFKRFMGVTPGAFRRAEFESGGPRRSLPKTVYFDRMEFSPGRRIAQAPAQRESEK